MKQGFYLVLLGLLLLSGSCQVSRNLEILNPPAYLLCGARYQFIVVSSPGFLRDLSWDARYGSIDGHGLYRAPDFPCQEVVGVTARGMRKEVAFPVVKDVSGEGTPEASSSSPSLRVVIDPPSLTASEQVSFGFVVRGRFSVILNGVVLQEDFSREEKEMTLSLPLEEGENLLSVFLEGKEVLRKYIFRDTTPPQVSLAQAVVTSEGVRLFGTATEEVTLGVAKSFGKTWEVLVPWQGERRVVFRDQAGNEREDVFSVERDVHLEVEGPSRVKLGQEASFIVRCRFRDVPLEEGTVWCEGAQVILERGEGVFSTKLQREGQVTLSFSLGGRSEVTVLVEVYAPSVALLSVTSNVPEEVVAGVPLVIEGMLEDSDGDPCPGKVVYGEISSSSSSVFSQVMSGTSGEWTLTFVDLSGFGKRTLLVSSEKKEWRKELYLISGEPALLRRIEPDSRLRLVAGSREVSFKVRAETFQGMPVQGTKVEWVWKSGDTTFPVPPKDLGVNERTGILGECSGTVTMPRKVGTYTLEARLAFWDVQPVFWEVTVLPANPGYFEDLSSLPASGKVGEPLLFTVRVRDIFGNPCPGKVVNVYRKEGSSLMKVQSVTTDEEGKASFSLTPEEQGVFIVEAWVSKTNLSLTWEIPVGP